MNSFKTVLEANKIIVTTNGVFVVKGYSTDGIFKLSINEINAIAYPVDSFIL